jgi:ABC-type lipoprotein export system ATPase subunit
VLDHWTGSVDPGEVVAVVGPSGCGKSTLLYILGALVRPWSGHVRIAGADVHELTDRGRSDIRASLIGFLFQDALLDERRSVLENVIEGSVYRGDDRRWSVQKAIRMLEALQVDVEPRRRATDLSGGQVQRVALCRALLHDPPLILADEPFGNLDPGNAAAVESILFRRAHAGAAVLIVTHDDRLASRCGRTFRL